MCLISYGQPRSRFMKNACSEMRREHSDVSNAQPLATGGVEGYGLFTKQENCREVMHGHVEKFLLCQSP